MSEMGTPHSALFEEETPLTPINLMSHKAFFQSLADYIEREKEYLQCPEEGPDEQRHIIYSFAFDKVIEYATAYKCLLTAIKKEYDDFISAIKRRDREAKLAHRKLKAMVAQPISLMYCQRRAMQLQERLAIIQRDTAEIQDKLGRLQDFRSDRRPSMEQKTSDNEDVLPGLTLDESRDVAALAKHLECLKSERAALQTKRECQRVSSEDKANLDSKRRAAQDQRDKLAAENIKLHLLHKRLKYVSDSLVLWEEAGQQVPLVEFLSTTLEDVTDIKVTGTNYHNINSVPFEDDDSAKVSEPKALVDYIERFTIMFEAGEYKAAAFHAARSPHGVLRNIETMEKFKSVTEYQGDLPPLLLFFQAMMISAHAGRQLPGKTLSVEGVRCALEHNFLELVTHGVTQQKLPYSEVLGDVIYEHAGREPRTADMCLALAHIVYVACGLHQQAALSMCKRGMLYGAMEFIYQCQNFTTEDCVCLLRGCPSLALLQLLTEDHQGQVAMMSVGQACHTLLLDTDLGHLACQLLENIHAGGEGVLEKVMLEDRRCSGEDWGEIANHCARRNRTKVSQEILSILLAQSGTARLSPGLQGVNLMDHVFM